MENTNTNIVYFKNEEGTKLAFEKLDEFEYEGKGYIILVEVDGDMPLIFEACEDGSYDVIENEDTLQAVYQLFRERNADKYDFDDEE